MERKIGEIFEYNGEWYQCLNGECTNCDLFIRSGCSSPLNTACSKRVRKDKQNVIFKKLEKVGEPYDKSGITVQKYKVSIPIEMPNEPYMYFRLTDSTLEIEIKQNKEYMEENKLNLKPFDIQKAREGKPVCTRDGRKARIICFDRDWDMHIVALVSDPLGESVHYYLSNGKVDFYKQNDEDLMMLPEKKEGWVNVYKKEQNRYVKGIFPSREIALNSISEKSREYIATIKITWEE